MHLCSQTHAYVQVGVKGQAPVLNGELHDQVKPEDCFWNISDGKLVEITLQKASKAGYITLSQGGGIYGTQAYGIGPYR